MKTTEVCASMIQMFEGFEPEPYQDAVGVWTIGYGFTGPLINESTPPMTEGEAGKLLSLKLAEFEKEVLALTSGVELKPHQLDALVSFAYNVGIGAFSSSTLLKLIRAGLVEDAFKEFRRWVYARGRKLSGLVARRRAESIRFLGGDFELIREVFYCRN